MTDKKISELGTITQGDIASGDWVAVVDSSENATKKFDFSVVIAATNSFDDVTTFFASTDTSAADTIVRTRAEGFAYRAVDTATATTVANAGVQAFEVLGAHRNAFYVAAYGPISPTDNAALLEKVAAAMPSTGGVVILPEGNFPIGRTVDFDVPEDTHVMCWGTRIVCTHDGIGIEVNSQYDPANPAPTTKRRVHFWGGNFENTNGTKTASEAVRAYGMRMCVFNQIYFTGFHTAAKISAKDTYIFNQCYWFANEISIHIPAIALAAGDKTLNIELNNCHFSNNNVTHAMLIEDSIAGLKVNGGSFNGDCSGGVIRFKDAALVQTEGIRFEGTHFEQYGAAGAIVFTETNGNGFYDILIEGEFSSAATGHKGVLLDFCRNVTIDSKFRDGAGGTTEVGIYVDLDSRGVNIHHGASFSASSPKFLFMSTPIQVEPGARRYITGIPSTILEHNPSTIAGFSASDSFSTTAETTIDMEAKITQLANWPLKPRGYFLRLLSRDSGSSGATNNFVEIRNATGGASDRSGLRVDLAGETNDAFRGDNGLQPCDEAGDISYATVATGTDTMGIQLIVNGAVF